MRHVVTLLPHIVRDLLVAACETESGGWRLKSVHARSCKGVEVTAWF